MRKRHVRAMLCHDLQPYQMRIFDHSIKRLVRDFVQENRHRDHVAGDPARLAREWTGFLLQQLSIGRQKIEGLVTSYQRFANRYTKSEIREEQRGLLLAFAADIGARSRQLRGDRRALKRYLDFDAMTDRYLGKRRMAEQRLNFFLERIGTLAVFALEQDPEQAADIWQGLQFERCFRPMMEYAGNPQLRRAAFSAFAKTYRALPTTLRANAISDRMAHRLYRTAMESREQIWYHIEAIQLLADVDSDAFERVLERWFTLFDDPDALFVRARLAAAWGRLLMTDPALVRHAKTIAADKSPFVRQAFIRAVSLGPTDLAADWLARYIDSDPEPTVRAAALLCLPDLVGRPLDLLRLWRLAVEVDQDAFVLRTAMLVAVRLVEAKAVAAAPLSGCLHVLLEQALPVPLRREASRCLEQIWLVDDDQAKAMAAEIVDAVTACPAGKRLKLPASVRATDPHQLARVLAVLAQTDFGLDLEPGWRGWRLRRGMVLGFRWWRVLREFRELGPAKRQGISHTRGRLARGRIRAPSAILAELAEAKVPGEPLYLSGEGGWRPYLPLVEDILSVLDFSRGKPVRFFTSEGITAVLPPPSFAKRLRAFWRLTWDFQHYVALRNWREKSADPPTGYLDALADLGFQVRIHPLADDRPVDPKVQRFFPTTIPLIPDNWWYRLREYFGTVYGNQLTELMAFLGGGLMLFLGRHAWHNSRIRRARHRIPLVIGGWGTRGKSGTERLKAALFASMGLTVYSKTTGCEAMFVHSPPYERLLELPLFRPYDKATIWEQGDVVRMARALRCDVFLWECMGLNPRYVNILQRQWMRDDISTITNTFPDHEDIQGPAGYNIPIVMNEFIPKGGRLHTTEESMLPILADACRELGTELTSYGWLEAGLLTPDVLARFPYEEHPYNIALVMGMARDLGIDPDYAVKEMADKVVPDLGVLKTFPAAPVRTRRLIFSNGMSANERLGCLTNWSRLGFDRIDPQTDPGTLVTAVVNNRADRISRSQMFANIMVQDLAVDRYLLIGSNLEGMLGYLDDSWQDFLQEYGLFKGTSAARLRQLADHLRVPQSAEQVRAHLQQMLTVLLPDDECDAALVHWDDLDRLATCGVNCLRGEAAWQALLNFHRDYREQQRQFDGLVALFDQQATLSPADQQRVCKTVTNWFKAKLHVVDDYYATGEQVVAQLVDITPFGFTNRIMGLQNIKGTGLDFAYRWLAWDRCYQLCQGIQSEDAETFAAALTEMTTYREFGVLSIETSRSALAAAKSNPVGQSEQAQGQLALITENFDEACQQLEDALNKVVEERSLAARFFDLAEEFLDVGDAVQRRKQCQRIYADLATARISRRRAIQELNQINKRQKGGWLWRTVAELWRGRLSRPKTTR